jgi:hypothetical protein
MEHLDPVLRRAGRVDKKVELPHAKDVMFQLFCMTFTQSEGDLDHRQSAEDNKEAKGYTHEFARNIPDGSSSQLKYNPSW